MKKIIALSAALASLSGCYYPAPLPPEPVVYSAPPPYGYGYVPGPAYYYPARPYYGPPVGVGVGVRIR